MTEREQEISAIMDLIWGLCYTADIGIIPKQDKRGVWRISILDAKSGKEYFLVRPKDAN